MSRDLARFAVPLLVLGVSGASSLGLFILWATHPERVNQELTLRAGLVATVIAGFALTEVVRRAIDPRLLIVSILLYLLGVGVTAVVSLVYAVFFSVFHAKDF